MARATKAAAKPAPEPEVEEDEFPLAYLLDKDPSEVHIRFCDWIADQTGQDDVADPKSVQLVISQWQKFQKTPEQQEFTQQKRTESAAKAAARDEAREAREAAPAAEKPVRTRTAKATAPADEEAAPARPARARRGQVTAPPAKRTSSRRRPAPAAAEDLD